MVHALVHVVVVGGGLWLWWYLSCHYSESVDKWNGSEAPGALTYHLQRPLAAVLSGTGQLPCPLATAIVNGGSRLMVSAVCLAN